MEALKKHRNNLCVAFKKAYDNFLTKLQSNDSTEEKLEAFKILEMKMTELDKIQAAYEGKIRLSDMEAVAKNTELSDMLYIIIKQQFLTTKREVTEIIKLSVQCKSNTSPEVVQKTVKLPKIEVPKFSGHIKEWLSFWSQFTKISKDKTMTGENKFQYLLQATVPGSRAYKLVSSFPPTAENYNKAVRSLRNRFGRSDLVLEYYTRNLLALAVQNAIRKKKVPLASIYDKMESNMRALETLGLSTDKFVGTLYPLVESSLPKNVLRAWKRSEQRKIGDSRALVKTKDRLTRLREFLRAKVEKGKREMTKTRIREPSKQKPAKKRKGKMRLTRYVANVPLILKNGGRSDECLLCKLSHEIKNCDIA